MAFSQCQVELGLAVFSITFLGLVFKCNGQITSSLQDEIKCTGENVSLSWTYNTANELVATWQFGTNTIMTGSLGGTPTVDNAYTARASHGGNGALTLTGLTVADSGTYSLVVTYGTALGSVSDSVQVTVYDKISQESAPVCGTNTVTCGSSSLSGVTYSWTVDGVATSDTSLSIASRSGSKTYACTISGDRVSNCLDAGIATTKSASCSFKESGGLNPGVIAAIVIGVLVVVISPTVTAILWKKKKLCFKVPTEKKPTGSTDSGIRSTSPNQVKPSVGNSDKKIDRLSVVDEKAQKLKTPGHLTADTVASPKPRALPPIPEKEAKKEKKKGSKKKRKKTKNEDGGEESVKVPSIEKKEKNMEHYTENTKEYESQ